MKTNDLWHTAHVTLGTSAALSVFHAESHCLAKLNCRGHGEFLSVNQHVDENRAFMVERGLDRRFHVPVLAAWLKIIDVASNLDKEALAFSYLRSCTIVHEIRDYEFVCI
jgi:hypothetical protein